MQMGFQLPYRNIEQGNEFHVLDQLFTIKQTWTCNNVAGPLRGLVAGFGVEGNRPCTRVPCGSIWNTVLASRGGSMGASVETPTGNSGS